MGEVKEETPFKARGEVLALLPDTSGNDINGLGEAQKRHASPIMWHDPGILAHGDLQNWFFANGTAPGANEHRASNQEFTAKPLPELAAIAADWEPEEASAKVKEAALMRESDIVGIARLNQDWVFEGYEAPYEWIVVLGVAMDWQCLKTAPSHKSQIEVQNQYGRGTRAAYKLAAWMREQGWDAHPHGGPLAGPVLMIPAAIEAGLGELGKHGSMINRRFGSSFRLASVMTDMPLQADGLDAFGADDFCANCKVCTNICPVDAITSEKQTVRGDTKWYVDFDECILYFVENNGCGMCIGQCPWSRTGTAPRLADKLARRRARR
ncbi:MAG: 4Fe-4S dicluster domain-containing protein [Rhodospirillales bacterium]|jgi:ferredoxin|nr:4Fe-4S dicluster domain-containing protein [Rhodospirillales bacterium]MDP6644124.1 4Fe-4S dicluster domain-containing protein [Rhodospirillales bacterium]MDP6843617.1 4Fe-4S dicluster domain-containing protein [Rhodospirillales bacterium]|tara:strand:- start:913 stop:1884 length:972 start_codon:yes stop_codon:yes gene_type:complete